MLQRTRVAQSVLRRIPIDRHAHHAQRTQLLFELAQVGVADQLEPRRVDLELGGRSASARQVAVGENQQLRIAAPHQRNEAALKGLVGRLYEPESEERMSRSTHFRFSL